MDIVCVSFQIQHVSLSSECPENSTVKTDLAWLGWDDFNFLQRYIALYSDNRADQMVASLASSLDL